jgi:hypothetical protein
MRCREALLALAAGALLALPNAALAASDPAGGEWTPLSAANIGNTNELGLLRTPDGVLHVLWVNNLANGTQALTHTKFTGTEPNHPGSPSPSDTVFTVNPAANQSFNDRVDLVSNGADGLRALFATTYPGSPIDGGLATSVSATGATWSPPVAASATAAGQHSPVYAASGIGGGTDLQGVTTGAWGDSSPDGGGYRVGLTTNGADSRFPATLGDIDPDVATDSVTGETVIAVNHSDVGINLISPTGAALGTVPQSAHAWTLQRTSITGRLGAPGVYVGYGTGDNMFSAKPAIYQVGASQFLFLKNQSDAAHVGITAAPEGRLWIYWDRGGKVYASRTNREVTKFGAIVSFPTPHGDADSVYRLAGEGSLGSLDLFALMDPTGDVNWWTERLMPGLKLEVVGNGTVEQGKKLKLKVTDAGDPVKGVDVYTVLANKKITEATNASGTAKLKIPDDASKGKEQAFTDAYPEYTDGKVKFKITGG